MLLRNIIFTDICCFSCFSSVTAKFRRHSKIVYGLQDYSTSSGFGQSLISVQGTTVKMLANAYKNLE